MISDKFRKPCRLVWVVKVGVLSRTISFVVILLATNIGPDPTMIYAMAVATCLAFKEDPTTAILTRIN